MNGTKNMASGRMIQDQAEQSKCVHVAGNHGNSCLSPMLYPDMVYSYDKAAVYTEVLGVPPR